ncbi:peptide-methionine (S)-S-oxide reductase [Mesorhizobium sp. J18]|nr:peptide-methionine (S)-S-oxide reductase [Mesorhizobium sp. J18]
MVRRSALIVLMSLTALAGEHGRAAADTAIFAGGCFWCVEADFDHVPGVTSTVSGYTGGTIENPTYRNYASGGHREAVRIEYDAARVSYAELLDVFFHSVDPTDAGGQFCDRGASYTTAIYALNDKQAMEAQAAKKAAEEELGRAIVTPIEPASAFWPAEAYHQNYYRSDERILTRFGYVTKAEAYKGYREGCGRDARLEQVWGAAALRGIHKQAAQAD